MFQVLLAFSIGAQPAEPDMTKVTPLQKKEFLELLKTLPSRGEFFTDEGVRKASPYLHVLLALDKKDINEDYYFALLALSRGLHDAKKQHREYAVKNFAKIPIAKVVVDVARHDNQRVENKSAFEARTEQNDRAAAETAQLRVPVLPTRCVDHVLAPDEWVSVLR